MRESPYFVLVSLLGGPLHGYAIIQRAGELSGGRVRLATGMLYAALDHLTAEGHVELLSDEIVSGRVRRSYGLTPRGAATLRAEAARGAESARLAEAARPVTDQGGDLKAGRPGPEDESRETRLERRCRLLLLAYPAWYRRRRGEEMLGTLLAATAPGVRWPSFGDARTLITGGLRVRGWTSLLSMLWVAAGAVITGYLFYNSTKPYSLADVDPRDSGVEHDSPGSPARRNFGNCRMAGLAYSSAGCRVRQASRLAAGQLAPRSRVGRRVDCRLRSHAPGRRTLGNMPNEPRPRLWRLCPALVALLW